MRERIYEVWLSGLHLFLSYLPIDLASSIGSAIVRVNVRVNRPEILDGARRNFSLLRPEMNRSAVNRAVSIFLDNVGRLMAEFACLERIDNEERVTISGLDAVRPYIGKAPVLAIILHTGNWEVFGFALKKAGIPVATFYEPPKNSVERSIAIKMRLKSGFRLLEPGSRGIKDSITILRSHGVVAIFGDEARGGKIMAPLFGRPPHRRGNLALAARLARKTNAKIVIGYCVRKYRCWFDLKISEPISLQQGKTLADDILDLNAQIEPIILENLDRWYFLDDLISPIEDDPTYKESLLETA